MGFGSSRHADANCNRYSDCNCNSDSYSAANSDRLANSNIHPNCYCYCHGYRYRDVNSDSQCNSDSYSAANSDRLADPNANGNKKYPATKTSADSAAAPVAEGDWREMSEGAKRWRKEVRSSSPADQEGGLEPADGADPSLARARAAVYFWKNLLYLCPKGMRENDFSQAYSAHRNQRTPLQCQN